MYKLKTYTKPYVQVYHNFLKTRRLSQRRYPVLFDESDNDFEKFLDLFIFYLCRPCAGNVLDWHPISEEWSSGHNNGKLLTHLLRDGKTDVFSGIMHAYQVFLKAGSNPVNLEDDMGKAFVDQNQAPDPNSNLHKTLKYFFENKDDVFLKHGIEDLSKCNYVAGELFPPHGSMWPMSVSENGYSYAIETDLMPFNTCFARHEKVHPWYYCGGYIAYKDFKRLGGQVYQSGDREHCYARSDIQLENWCFVYQRQTERKKGLYFSVDQMKQNILDLKKSGVRNIEREVLEKFFRLTSMLKQKLTLSELIDS